jgi:hypothetical protein
VSQTVFGCLYILKIWKKKASPTLTTWILFFAGCMPSSATYFLAENWDIKSGILNTTDLVYVTAILLAIIIWGKRDGEDRFETLEKWCLAGAVAVVCYWIVTGRTWGSNVLMQCLMVVAYIPMLHKMISQRKNRESFFGWLPGVLNGAVALYPAIHEGNALSVIYAVRSLTSCILTSAIMAYYQFIRKAKS